MSMNCMRHAEEHEPHDWSIPGPLGMPGVFRCNGLPARDAGKERKAPTVGQTVHYVSHGTPVREDGTQRYASQCRAAIITDVSEEMAELVQLCVLSPEGMFFTPEIAYEPSVNRVGGSWHWPVCG